MTPPAVLTQEEIAEGERRLAHLCAQLKVLNDGDHDAYGAADDMDAWLHINAPRIFATIRALRERVKELEEELKAGDRPWRDDHPELL